MLTEKFFQPMKDGTEIAVNRWIPDDKEHCRAVIVLSHGMLEHSLRYDRAGCLMAEAGFVFSAHDHRGHGKTAFTAEQKGTGTFGLLAKKNGFEAVVSDLAEIIEKAKADFPGKKIILLGHSFGSFVAQAYIEQKGGLIDGCVLCGTAGPMNGTVWAGKLLTGVVSLFHKPEYKSEFVQKVVFGGYNKRIPEVITGFEWISANKANVDMYMNDSWCGGTACIGFFRDLLGGLLKIHKKSAMKKIPCTLPVFLIAGQDDPVGKYGKTIEKLADIYRKNGMQTVDMKFYPGDRHELFNELDGDKAVQNVLDWITRTVLK